MAVTFSDLHTEAGIKALNEYLSGKSYISGYVVLNFNKFKIGANYDQFRLKLVFCKTIFI